MHKRPVTRTAFVYERRLMSSGRLIERKRQPFSNLRDGLTKINRCMSFIAGCLRRSAFVSTDNKTVNVTSYNSTGSSTPLAAICASHPRSKTISFLYQLNFSRKHLSNKLSIYLSIHSTITERVILVNITPLITIPRCSSYI